MTVNATTALSAPQAADGSNRTWYFPFKIIDADQIVLHLLDLNEVETLVASGFTVVGIGSDNGGQVTYPLEPVAPLPNGMMVRVGRQVAYEQPDRLGNQGPYLPRIHEGAFDRLEMQIQQLAEQSGRALLTSVFTPPGSVVLPPPQPGSVLIWDANGQLSNSATDVSNFETSAINAQAAAEIAMAMAASAADAAAAAAESAESGGGGGGGGGTNLPVGTTIEYDGLMLPAKWLWCNGTEVSRETYALLFAALCPPVIYTATSGSPTLTVVSPNFSALGVNGADIEGQGIPVGAWISGIAATTITLSANATATGTFTGHIIPWGGGDGSTTFNLPDKLGRSGFARDNMGVASVDRLTLGGELLGWVGGLESNSVTVQAGATSTNVGTASKLPPMYVTNKIIYTGNGETGSSSGSDYWIAVDAFGPVGTGDDYATLQAAFSSGLPIELGPRDYLCGGQLIVTNVPLAVRGVRDRSRIVFTNNTPGIQIFEDAIQSVWLEDFSIWTKTVCDHTALSVDRNAYPAGKLWRHWPLQYFRGLSITSENNTLYGWKNGIVMDQCTDPKFDDLYIEGKADLSKAADDPDRYWGWTIAGISVQDTRERIVVGTKLTNCFITGCQVGMEQRGPMEGLVLENCVFLGCKIGVNDDRRYMDTLTGPGHPGLTMIGCHGNCGQYCVKSQNSFFGVISHCLFYEFVYTDVGWEGIHHEHGNGMKFTFNEFRASSISVAGRGIGIYVAGTNQTNIFGNHFTYCREPIVLGSVDSGVGETISRNNTAHGLDGEQTPVIYDGAVSRYSNPASSYVGIIAEGSNDALISLDPGVQSTLPGGVTLISPVGARYRINAQITMFKGGSTPGVSRFWAQKFSGAGDIAFFHDYGEIAVQNDLHDDGVHWTAQLSGVMKITVAGGIVLAFHARSDGGAGSIAINAYQYVIERIG